MGKMTKLLNMRLKKTLFPSAKSTNRILNLRYEFWQKLREVCFKDLIFIDKSGANLAMVSTCDMSFSKNFDKFVLKA
jgi:hypothetical protein